MVFPHLSERTSDASTLWESTRMGKRPKERLTIIQEEAVQTQTSMDFRSTLSAVFRPRTQVTVVWGNKRKQDWRKRATARARTRHVGKGIEDDSRKVGAYWEESQGEGWRSRWECWAQSMVEASRLGPTFERRTPNNYEQPLSHLIQTKNPNCRLSLRVSVGWLAQHSGLPS